MSTGVIENRTERWCGVMNIYLPQVFPPDISVGWVTEQEVRFIFQNVWAEGTIFIYETITLKTFIKTKFNFSKSQSNKSDLIIFITIIIYIVVALIKVSSW